jgi:hypothetical protein
MRRYLVISLIAFVAVLTGGGMALAQSGHFVGDVTCEDIGTQLQCLGKVAGLGGTTFEITCDAEGATGSVECTNPGWNVAPGQDFETDVAGSTGPQPTPRNGSFRFDIDTVAPVAPPGSCPNPGWTADVVDVDFCATGVTVSCTLSEDGVVSDTRTPIVDCP